MLLQPGLAGRLVRRARPQMCQQAEWRVPRLVCAAAGADWRGSYPRAAAFASHGPLEGTGNVTIGSLLEQVLHAGELH